MNIYSFQNCILVKSCLSVVTKKAENLQMLPAGRDNVFVKTMNLRLHGLLGRGIVCLRRHLLAPVLFLAHLLH